MNRFACPACGEPAISSRDKFRLGPMRAVRCRYCRARVSVAALPSLILLALATLAFPFGFIAGFWLCQSSGSLPLSIFAGLVGFIALPLLFRLAHLRLVPLVVREG